MKVIYQVEPWGWTPFKAHPQDAGYDLKATIFKERVRGRLVIDTGVHIYIPEGYTGLVLPRSSMSLHGVNTATGVIDAGYTGTIKVVLEVPEEFEICAGERIAQIVIVPQMSVELVPGAVSSIRSERGARGFGSSGK